jgi:hypothetical protein
MDCLTSGWLISDMIKVWLRDGGIRNMCGKPVMLMPDFINIIATKGSHFN